MTISSKFGDAEHAERAARDADEPRGFKVVDRRLNTLVESGVDLDSVATTPAGQKPSFVRQLEDKVAFLEKALADTQARMREMATAHQDSSREVEAYKSRLRQEREDEIERQKGLLAARFFDVLDNLDRTLAALPSHDDGSEANAIEKGLRLVHAQFSDVLRGLGVARIETSGVAFDPGLHEALMTQPVTDAALENRVLHEVRPGFRRGDQVLRAAQVIVGRL